MKIQHKVRINIADRNGNKKEVLQSEHISLPKRLLTFLFGEFCEILVLKPGQTVQGIEIKELGFPQKGVCSDKRGDRNA